MRGYGAAILVGGVVTPVDSIQDPRFQAMWEGDQSARIVDKTLVSANVNVSTVFLGLNHGFFGEDLWFETMIFGGPNDEYCERYPTLEAAKAGHQRAVRIARRGPIRSFLLRVWSKKAALGVLVRRISRRLLCWHDRGKVGV